VITGDRDVVRLLDRPAGAGTLTGPSLREIIDFEAP
jgi:hypothetical protein